MYLMYIHTIPNTTENQKFREIVDREFTTTTTTTTTTTQYDNTSYIIYIKQIVGKIWQMRRHHHQIVR
jgi:hypothetical protein